MKITFIQVHAPTADSSDNEINSFYNDLQITLNNIPKKRTMLSFWETSMLRLVFPSPYGKIPWANFGISDINECGERLLQFCIANEFLVANTAFPHTPSRKWTCNHPNGVHKSMIDYVIVRK